MKKNILKIISILMFSLTILSLILFIDVFTAGSGGGFLDLSNLAEGVFLCVMLLSAIIGGITAHFGWKRSN